jgi:hypothetical protein
VVAELERHTADGRLSLTEYSERAARVYRATTYADLAAITHDLPTLPPPERTATNEHRHLIVAMLLAAATIALLGTAIALWR